MDAKLTHGDQTVLDGLAEYQALSMAQLACLCSTSRQMVGRRAKSLGQKGLVSAVLRSLAGSVGRPETVIRLTEKGMLALEGVKSNSGKRAWLRIQDSDGPGLEHQLLLNWVRLHLIQGKRCPVQLAMNYLSSARASDYEIGLGCDEGTRSIIPDGIFSIAHPDQQKSLLFFLEVDMGTESLAGVSPQSIQAKVEAYKAVFRAGQYRKFEAILSGTFLGFRVLFLANSPKRFDQLCRLVASIKNTDFVWLTDQDSMFREGIFDNIWVKGGRRENGPFSIVGPTLAFKTTLEDHS